MLFAALGFVLGGIDDVLLDLVWLTRAAWRRAFVYSRHPRTNTATLAAGAPGPIAVFVPAWDEAAVIEAMLRHFVATTRDADYRLFVGLYPNDGETRAAVARVGDPRVTAVLGERPGPTTKAACCSGPKIRAKNSGQKVRHLCLINGQNDG